MQNKTEYEPYALARLDNLPADVNQPIEQKAQEFFNNEELNSVLVEARDNLYYGKCTFWGIISGTTLIPIAHFNFGRGVCARINFVVLKGRRPVEYTDHLTTFELTYENEKLIKNKGVAKREIEGLKRGISDLKDKLKNSNSGE